MKRDFTRQMVPGIFLFLMMLTFFTAGPALGADITVNSTLDNVTAGDGQCTLREALNNANADGDTTAGDCAERTGDDAIILAAGAAAADPP